MKKIKKKNYKKRYIQKKELNVVYVTSGKFGESEQNGKRKNAAK